jgi:hypothetical protein
MVAPIVASAGGVLVEKASDEDSIINTAFKFTLLIGLAIAIGLGIFLIYQLTSIFQGFIDIIEPIINGSATGISLLGLGVNVLLNSTIFGQIIKRSV